MMTGEKKTTIQIEFARIELPNEEEAHTVHTNASANVVTMCFFPLRYFFFLEILFIFHIHLKKKTLLFARTLAIHF